jgi:nicotinamide-nucleotide amidase
MTAAEILAIGDELVHGALLDTNSRYITRELESHGLPVRRFTVVGDDPQQLAAAMADACRRADVVVATGGLGPTLDDRTREVAAELVGAPLQFDAAAWEMVRQYLSSRRRPVPESNRRQALFPLGATVLSNPVGTAPGFRVRIDRAELFVLPGVPREMRVMLQDHVLPFVAALPGARPTAQYYLRVVGPSEALLGERIAAFMVADRNPAVGVTVSAGMITIRIVATAATAAAAAAMCAATADELRPLLGEWLLAEGLAELPELAVRRLAAAGLTLATAESCTGGLVAAALTDVAGVSAVFRGGFVTYSDASKLGELGVDAAVLADHGAVSEAVAAAMATGAANRLGARLGLSVTGIAGPDGGTPDKPVGTVCFGLAADGRARSWTLRIPDLGRDFIRQRAVVEAWAALLRLPTST